jgi:hypothetical protein
MVKSKPVSMVRTVAAIAMTCVIGVGVRSLWIGRAPVTLDDLARAEKAVTDGSLELFGLGKYSK